jgi:methionine sulfoxide reductase heme-binding subunit
MAPVKTYWYLTRSSGAVALVLLTVSVVIGIAVVGRLHSRRWPRFAVDGVHRAGSLLALVFLAIHIITAVLDSFAPITLINAVVPFTGAYRPLWLGLGTTAFDLLLAVAVTSFIRPRLGHRRWRMIHWLAYLVWPIAVLHGLGTGSDVQQGWMTAVYAVCGAAVLVAVMTRLAVGWPRAMPWRLTGAGAVALFGIGLAVWLPAGPLAPHWAKRAGTPTRLLHSSAPPRRGAS